MVVVIAAVLAYFVCFPEDAKAIAAPIATLPELTRTIAPGVYLVLAVGLLAWAIIRVWGRVCAK